MKLLRVGIVGFGVVGKRRFSCFTNHPATEVVSIADKTLKDDNFEESIKVYSDFKELINNEKQKVISISSLKFENKKIILESEEDLIEHINNYKKTILKEIRLGNKVKI